MSERYSEHFEQSLIDNMNPVLKEHVDETAKLSQALSLPDNYQSLEKLAVLSSYPGVSDKIDGIKNSILSKEKISRMLAKRRER